MADTEALQKKLVGEMRGRIKEDDSSVPMQDGPWAYGVRYEEGAQHPKYVRVPASGGEFQVVLDGDAEAAGKAYFRLGGTGHSPDHKLLAWASDEKGSEYFTVRFRDLQTGSDAPQCVPDTAGGGVFSKDSKHFFYTRLDDNHRPSRLFVHTLGQSPETDRLVHEELDPGMFLSAGKSQSGDYIIIDSHDHETSQAWLLPADQPFGKPVLVSAREEGVEYSVDEGDGTLYILTNQGGAKDFRICARRLLTGQGEMDRHRCAQAGPASSQSQRIQTPSCLDGARRRTSAHCHPAARGRPGALDRLR